MTRRHGRHIDYICLYYVITSRDRLYTRRDGLSHITATKIFTIEEADTVTVLPHRVSRENVKTFRWKCGRMEDAISIITHYVLTFSVESLRPIGENHCWTTERKRCNYRGAAPRWLHLVFSDISYELLATRVCLFVEMHANINPIIRRLLYSISRFLSICFSFRWEKVEIYSISRILTTL